jgi:pullulanase
LILVKGDGNGSTAVVSAGTLPAWMAYVFTILVAVVIGTCSVWSQKKAGKAGRK